jgi:uncharacterized protein (DUF1015 family)
VAHLDPFRAVLYASSIDPALVTTPPYDVISEPERRRLERLHPYNFVKVVLGTELPGDRPGQDKYTRAAAHLRAWMGSGVLRHENGPRLYAYRMDYRLGGAARATGGVIGALTLEDLGGSVRPHERTMPRPRSDRLKLMRTTMANLEPIWLVGGAGVVGVALAAASRRAPLVDFADPTGVRHRLWPLEEREAAPFAGGLQAPLVIADGHHRYAAALEFRDEMRASSGPGPWDATLALVSDPAELPPSLLPTHRLTRLGLDDLRPRLELTPFAGDLPSLAAHLSAEGPGVVGVAAAAGRWTTPSYGSPDTAWLAGKVLEPAGAAVAYEHDLDRVAEAVEAGALAFVLAPIPVDTVIETALAGEVMPPKSTLFWPKPRTGILLRDLLAP